MVMQDTEKYLTKNDGDVYNFEVKREDWWLMSGDFFQKL